MWSGGQGTKPPPPATQPAGQTGGTVDVPPPSPAVLAEINKKIGEINKAISEGKPSDNLMSQLIDYVISNVDPSIAGGTISGIRSHINTDEAKNSYLKIVRQKLGGAPRRGVGGGGGRARAAGGGNDQQVKDYEKQKAEAKQQRAEDQARTQEALVRNYQDQSQQVGWNETELEQALRELGVNLQAGLRDNDAEHLKINAANDQYWASVQKHNDELVEKAIAQASTVNQMWYRYAKDLADWAMKVKWNAWQEDKAMETNAFLMCRRGFQLLARAMVPNPDRGPAPTPIERTHKPIPVGDTPRDDAVFTARKALDEQNRAVRDSELTLAQQRNSIDNNGTQVATARRNLTTKSDAQRRAMEEKIAHAQKKKAELDEKAKKVAEESATKVAQNTANGAEKMVT